MKHWGFERVAFAALVLLVFGVPCSKPACTEKPTVIMDENTAASHLLRKIDPELPVHMAWQGVTGQVVLRVTVDRQGKICDVKPLLGRAELIKSAMDAVRKHWRYRPFLVDWKPVVAQFWVTVKFVPPRREPHKRAHANIRATELLSSCENAASWTGERRVYLGRRGDWSEAAARPSGGVKPPRHAEGKAA